MLPHVLTIREHNFICSGCPLSFFLAKVTLRTAHNEPQLHPGLDQVPTMGFYLHQSFPAMTPQPSIARTEFFYVEDWMHGSTKWRHSLGWGKSTQIIPTSLYLPWHRDIILCYTWSSWLAHGQPLRQYSITFLVKGYSPSQHQWTKNLLNLLSWLIAHQSSSQTSGGSPWAITT